MQTEYEIISYEKLRHLKIFLNKISYRNYHSHSTFEWLLPLGPAKLSLRGETIALEDGSLVILNPYEFHEIDAMGSSVDIVVFQISQHFCRDYVPMLQNIHFDQRNAGAFFPDRTAHRLICETALSFLRQEPYFEFRCIEKTAKLFRLLLENVPYTLLTDGERASLSEKIRRMQRLSTYIEEHYTQPLRLSDLAALEGITATHLSHFFTENFGIPFQEYLNNLRFEQASTLLRDPEISLNKAALACGFSDPKYLQKMIRKRANCDFREYRLQLQDISRGFRQSSSGFRWETIYAPSDASKKISTCLNRWNT